MRHGGPGTGAAPVSVDCQADARPVRRSWTLVGAIAPIGVQDSQMGTPESGKKGILSPEWDQPSLLGCSTRCDDRCGAATAAAAAAKADRGRKGRNNPRTARAWHSQAHATSVGLR